jgi:transposase
VASHRALSARSAVVHLLAEQLLDLAERITTLDRLIEELLLQDEACTHLQSIPGVGVHNAATIRAELGEAARFDQVDQVIAYAGLDPRTAQSGLHQGQRHLSKRGPGALRHALYLATVVAVRIRPEWRSRYLRLQERGRKKKEALVILSRSLLKVVFHLLCAHEPYEATRIGPASA